MTTKDIRTYHPHTVCDVCGRTLLRGERSEVYINGGARRSVCELCKTRAIHEGWVREGTVPDYDQAGAGSERRRSLLGRLRRRDAPRRPGRPTLDDELAGGSWQPPESDLDLDVDLDPNPGPTLDPNPGPEAWAPPPPLPAHYHQDQGYEELSEEEWDDQPLEPGPDKLAAEPPPPAPDEPPSRRPWSRRPRSLENSEEAVPAPARRSRRPARQPASDERRTLGREPRHVRAVPSSDEQKTAAAVVIFNQSEHRRTVAGVARSLGGASVTVLPAPERPSLVSIVVCWELCWYRYVVDLADQVPGVRMDGQGYELDELSQTERAANAVADESGQLILR